jgi:hypothetical protein
MRVPSGLIVNNPEANGGEGGECIAGIADRELEHGHVLLLVCSGLAVYRSARLADGRIKPFCPVPVVRVNLYTTGTATRPSCYNRPDAGLPAAQETPPWTMRSRQHARCAVSRIG